MSITAPYMRLRSTLPRQAPRAPRRAVGDDDLLLEVATGDHEAFATLYDHLAGLVYANIRRVLHDTIRTDAVVEETFIEVWRRAPRYDPVGTPAATWILDLAHQLAAERVRSEGSLTNAGPSAVSDPRRSGPPATFMW